MTGKVTKLLDDFHTIAPHLTVRGVADAIAFYASHPDWPEDSQD